VSFFETANGQILFLFYFLGLGNRDAHTSEEEDSPIRLRGKKLSKKGGKK